MLEVGRLCLKTAGREAGSYCVVLKKVDKEFVLVTGPRAVTSVKRRRCNMRHLEPAPFKVEIKEEASDADVVNAMDKAGLLKKLNLRKPTAEELKQAEEKKAKKEEKPKVQEKKKEEKKKETKTKPVEHREIIQEPKGRDKELDDLEKTADKIVSEVEHEMKAKTKKKAPKKAVRKAPKKTIKKSVKKTVKKKAAKKK